jgi:hypothetical protein
VVEAVAHVMLELTQAAQTEVPEEVQVDLLNTYLIR